MNTLLVATSSTPEFAECDIACDRRPRIDYIELAHRLATRYIDENEIHDGKILRQTSARLHVSIGQAVQVSRIARREHYGRVVSLSERVGMPLSCLLGRKTRHIVVGHHLLSTNKIRLIKESRLYRRWDKIIVLTRAEAEALEDRLRLSPGKVLTVNPPVDIAFFRPCEGVRASVEQEYVLSVGLSCRDYPTLIRAMRKLPKVTAHIRAGSSWVDREAGYEHEAIPANVLPMKPVAPHLLRECYMASRFVVVPIRETTQWSAGTNAVLEAQAMGKAVIATRTPGLTEYVRDGETGILVGSGDSAAMAEAIEYLWNHPERAAIMGQRAREWVVRQFALDRWLDSMTNLLDELDDTTGSSLTH
jgi:glycosyltransferase involved in cell wall biosynthesis